MIPEFNQDGELPPGVHLCSYEELEARFSGSLRRRELLRVLHRYWADVRIWKEYVVALVIDGSFVSAETEPGDIDILVVTGAPVRSRNPNFHNCTSHDRAARVYRDLDVRSAADGSGQYRHWVEDEWGKDTK